jgi:uncharacterized membrane protein
MASVATKPRSGEASHRSSPTRRARAAAPNAKKSTQAIKKKAQSGGGKVAKEAVPGGKAIPKKLAGAAAKKALKLAARKAVKAGATTLRALSERGGELGRSAVEQSVNNRLPVQVSVDVAAPLDFVWDEWMGGRLLPEGVHRVEELERDQNRLTGKIAGSRAGEEWKAEILDEREYESFAWRSVEGSDCAGLVTFHRLSDRLTRIELDLDVLPINPGQALSLSLHLAHRHAEADLRRFKARVEFISPDVYENNGPDEEPDG